jgi:hypothetical protein
VWRTEKFPQAHAESDVGLLEEEMDKRVLDEERTKIKYFEEFGK